MSSGLFETNVTYTLFGYKPYIYIYTHTHIYMYIYIYIYTHTNIYDLSLNNQQRLI